MSLREQDATEGSRPLRFHRDRFPGQPALDTAVSHAMLRRVAAGSVGESLRLYVPEKVLLFSSLDARQAGYESAISLAQAAGFPAVIRLGGGQAAAFLDQSIAFAWASPDPDARLHIRDRFERVSEWIAVSLRRLGLDARVGEVPGEYCPGAYSVNIAGSMKVMGIGQRVIRGAAHVGGVLTIAQTDLLREVLTPIYAKFERTFDPEAVAGLADLDPSLTAEKVIATMARVLQESGYRLEPQSFDDEIRHEAKALVPHHEPRGRSDLGAVLRESRRDGKAIVQNEAPGSLDET